MAEAQAAQLRDLLYQTQATLDNTHAALVLAQVRVLLGICCPATDGLTDSCDE